MQDLYETTSETVGTALDFRMKWVNMSDVTVLDENNNLVWRIVS